MYPASSSVRTRRRQGGGEMPTRLASSTLVIRPSAWISLRILRSISSRFFDTRVRFLGRQSLRGISATLLAQLVRLAQFYCARVAPFITLGGKIRRYGLQFLHSLQEALSWIRHFRRRRDAFPAHSSRALSKIPLREGSTLCLPPSTPRWSSLVPARPATPRQSMPRARCLSPC